MAANESPFRPALYAKNWVVDAEINGIKQTTVEMSYTDAMLFRQKCKRSGYPAKMRRVEENQNSPGIGWQVYGNGKESK